jgi:hypothetical protein
MEQPDFERRKQQRRQDEHDAVAHLGADRRQGKRRQYPRLAYPLAVAPQILNMRSQVVGISAKAVRFFFSDFDPQASTLKQGSKIKITLRFHDGQVVKTTATVLRRDQYQEDREHFVCLFDHELPPERIDREQTYLQKKFPDVSSEKLWDSAPILFFD